jgi:hypothetical protein
MSARTKTLKLKYFMLTVTAQVAFCVEYFRESLTKLYPDKSLNLLDQNADHNVAINVFESRKWKKVHVVCVMRSTFTRNIDLI